MFDYMFGGVDLLGWVMQKVMILPAIIIALSLHEFAHAKAADMLGDPTPRNYGRVTLNPIAHLDALGFIALILAGFGWGKPVPVNGANFKNFKRDEIIVSLAGVTTNLLLAVVFMGVLKLFTVLPATLLHSDSSAFVINLLFELVFNIVWINLVLMVFNLIPCPPLDGFNALAEILNLREKGLFYQIYEKGPLILFLLIILNVTDKIIGPAVNFVLSILWNIFM